MHSIWDFPDLNNFGHTLLNSQCFLAPDWLNIVLPFSEHSQKLPLPLDGCLPGGTPPWSTWVHAQLNDNHFWPHIGSAHFQTKQTSTKWLLKFINAFLMPFPRPDQLLVLHHWIPTIPGPLIFRAAAHFRTYVLVMLCWITNLIYSHLGKTNALIFMGW